MCIFNWGVVHHPAQWASVRGHFIFRRCMVQNLRFLLALASQPLPLWTTWGSGASVAPPYLWVYQVLLIGASFVFPGLHSSSFIGFGVFAGGSAPSSLGVLWNAYLACTWRSSAHFIRALWALPGALDWISLSWGDPLRWESSMTSQTDLSLVLDSSFGQDLFHYPLHWFLLEELLAWSRRSHKSAGLIVPP